MFPNFFALVVVGVTCAVLFYVAFVDWRDYKIKNEFVMLIAALYFFYVLATGTWDDALRHIVFALAIFFIMLVCYHYGLLGGGDAKLITVAFLWVGLDCAFLFSVVMLAISSVHAGLAHFNLVGVRTVNGRRRIAYAPAVAGALVVVLGSGCLQHHGLP